MFFTLKINNKKMLNIEAQILPTTNIFRLEKLSANVPPINENTTQGINDIPKAVAAW
ncbi:hypothetical protein FPFC_040020 [Fructobacillus pseudoficulneus]|uniref:Uncharacterized protein n=1 Tax=Fructobacillus pseudoficulneus TaxID=220714 RepID=A0A3F3GY96_9LACO|nr:hypothetical protein FPFC_040020 [Fructobacillus pseudoficulneus]